MVLAAIKAERDDNGSVRVPGLPFRLLDWGIALNVADEVGNRYDLEISSHDGFTDGTIYRPSIDAREPYEVPRVGDWVEVVNPAVSDEIDDYGKKKLRIHSALQIRKLQPCLPKRGAGKAAATVSTRKKRV